MNLEDSAIDDVDIVSLDKNIKTTEERQKSKRRQKNNSTNRSRQFLLLAYQTAGHWGMTEWLLVDQLSA